MKLHELIETTDERQIIEATEALDHKNVNGYLVVLGRLKTLQPSNDDGWSVIIGPPRLGPGESLADYGGILDLYGKKKDEEQRYALEFTPWAEWLVMDVRVNGVDLTPAQMIAQCLYEMTYFGYNEDDIQAHHAEIDRRVDEILDMEVEEDEGRC